MSQTDLNRLADAIHTLWERRADLKPGDDAPEVFETLDLLDAGRLRVAEPDGAGWRVNGWAKEAVLLSFRLTPNRIMTGGPDGATWWDKVPPKFQGWGDTDYDAAGFRAVPGAIVRRSAYVAPDAVLMPSFVNAGAYVGARTMVDTWATVGSCAQIGSGVHISGGVGIGGVLEPIQAAPVIIEDDCFIGARSEVAEGVRVRKGSVISMGVFLGASTPIVDRETGETFRGEVPPYSVVVPGVRPARNQGEPSLACAVIVKRVDAQTRSKTGVNDLLRAVDA